MNKLKIPTKIFNDIKKGIENLIITKEDKLEKEATIKLVDDTTGEEIEAQITFKQKFRTIKEAIENIAITSIKNESEYLDFIGEVTVYRIKTEIEVDIKELIKDNEIYNIIDKNELKENGAIVAIGLEDKSIYKIQWTASDKTKKVDSITITMTYTLKKTNKESLYKKYSGVRIQNK